jgi:hypothetical protein
MKKVMLLAAMLAMMALAAMPALAADFEIDSETGDVDQIYNVDTDGNGWGDQCVAINANANTGSATNLAPFDLSFSDDDDLDLRNDLDVSEREALTIDLLDQFGNDIDNDLRDVFGNNSFDDLEFSPENDANVDVSPVQNVDC